MKQEQMVRCYKLTMNGTSCIFTSVDSLLEDLHPSLEEDFAVGESAKIEVTEMSQKDLDNLPEFQGW